MNKLKKYLMFLCISVVTLLSVCACSSSGLDENNDKIYKICVKVFKNTDDPKKSDLISGSIEEYNLYACLNIETDGKQEYYLYDLSNDKIYTMMDTISFFGNNSYEFETLVKIANYKDSYIDYEKINEALDKKFN